MAYWGIAFMMNGQGVDAPDDIDWTHISMGDALTGQQRRSPYMACTWTKRAHWGCDMSWFDFDNTILTHFVCPPPDESKQYEVYTDAICQTVKAIHRHGSMFDIQAVILVRVY